MTTPTDSVTVLSHAVGLATKKWFYDTKGHLECQGYDKEVYEFACEQVEVDGLESLAKLLDKLRPRYRTMVIRGTPLPGTDLSCIGRRIRTTKLGGPTMRGVPRRWVMIDIDLKDRSEWDYSTPEACEKVAKSALARLPLELRVAGCYWQLSSSAGMKPGLRAHLWFWLDRPCDDLFLLRYAASVNDREAKPIIDDSLFNPVQPHYIADPIFQGPPDPVVQRSGIIEGPPAELPKMLTRENAWKRLLEPLYLASNDAIHEHLIRASASYFCAKGGDADGKELYDAAERAVRAAESHQGREGDYLSSGKFKVDLESGRPFAKNRAQSGERILTNEKGEPKNNIGNLIAIMESHLDWADMLVWNARSKVVEITRPTPWGTPIGRWVAARDDVKAAQWFAQEMRCPADLKNVFYAVVAFAREREYDPVTDWLCSLRGQHNGKQYLDWWLSGWCGADETDYVRRVGRMFLISMVARAMQPGCQVDTVLCLSGAQGRKKTSLLKALGGEWYASVIDDKDLIQQLHGPWLVELPELGPFRQTDYNRMKGLVDRRVDHIRLPFMRDVEDLPRRCVMSMTDNPDGVGWQRDPTGGRRWLPVDIRGDIDVDAVVEAREQLFAEAVMAYDSGEHWWVEPDDPDFVAAQDAVRADDPWLERIRRAINSQEKSYGGPNGSLIGPLDPACVSISDVMMIALGDTRQSRGDAARAAACLMRLGYRGKDGLWRPE